MLISLLPLTGRLLQVGQLPYVGRPTKEAHVRSSREGERQQRAQSHADRAQADEQSRRPRALIFVHENGDVVPVDSAC